MSHRFGIPVRALLVVALLLASLASITASSTAYAAAQSDRGLIDANSYQSPQFGYTLTWSGPWTTQDRDVITNPGGFDTISLRGDGATVRVSGRADTYEPLVFLQDTIAIQLASGGELIDQDTTGTVPTAELLIGNERMRIDVVPLPEAGAIVLLTLRANQTSYDAALATAGQNIELESSPLFGADGLRTGGTEATATATATEEIPTLPTVAETATEETPAPPTATPPAIATEDATPGSTQAVMGGGVEGNVYTSPNFGFAVTWDDTLWDLRPDSELSEPDYDAFQLVNDTGLLSVTGWTTYNGSASTCLLGEITYYNDPEGGITDWQVAVDADGNELTGETETSAWGVFTNTYVDPDDPGAAPIDYVDYIECQSLGDDAVVIFYAFSEREAYNDHIGQVLAVVDTLELAEGTELPAVEPTEAATPASIQAGTPVATPVGGTPVSPAVGTPIATPVGGTPVSVLPSGETITGQAHGYRFTVPAGWQVSESRLGAEPESTTLGNGTSTVSVGARSLSVPTLSDCVATIADEHEADGTYGDLRLAATASGDPFAGEDDFTAFANFTYTGPDGALWAHFIECRWIVEGQSVLVVTQDVPQELFGSERGPRRQIQNTIEVGP